jgi:hypothetical protein
LATLAKVSANSLEGQVDQLSRRFVAVQKTAGEFEDQDRRVKGLLFQALADVYGFGEEVYDTTPPSGTSLFREFFVKLDVPFNSRTQANPYIGLVKLAFRASSASSQSQYATVLNYAHVEGIDPADFRRWLMEEGIEARRSQALDALASRQRQINNQARTAQLNNATSTLLARPASASVALPEGVKAPEGFALVLARVDADNNACIVEVVDTAAEKLDPILLSLTTTKPVERPSEPLAPLLRAVDLILGTTPDKPGDVRDLLIGNVDKHGSPRALVQAISNTYSFPGAEMELDGHVGALPVDQPFVLKAADARYLLDMAEKHRNWTLDEHGTLTADDLSNPIKLEALESPGTYRVAVPTRNSDKPLRITHDEFSKIAAYIQRERNANAENNKKRNEPRVFPAAMELSLDGNRILGKLSTSLLNTTIAETSAETDLDERMVGVSDLETLAETMKLYEVDADGWLMDGDVENAALVIEAFFDNDLLRVVLPTRTGMSYNQVCEPLA